MYHCIKIICVDTDCLAASCREIVILTWVSRQSNWIETKTLSSVDVQLTVTCAFKQNESSSGH